MLGHGSQDMDGKPVGIGHIGGNEVHTAFHQAGNEMDVTGKPVQLGNDERRLEAPAVGQGSFQLGPVFMPLAAFNFVLLADELPTVAVGESLDGAALRFLSKAACTLTGGADAVIGDVAAFRHLPPPATIAKT